MCEKCFGCYSFDGCWNKGNEKLRELCVGPFKSYEDFLNKFRFDCRGDNNISLERKSDNVNRYARRKGRGYRAKMRVK